MTALNSLADGLDALDDFVKSRMRQAVADLRVRQDQIDAALDRPGELTSPAQPIVMSAGGEGVRRDGDAVPLNDEERDDVDAATVLGRAAAAESAAEQVRQSRGDADDGPPATWLVT